MNTSPADSVTVALTTDERVALDDWCARQGVSRSRVMRDALRDWMLRHGEDFIRPSEEVCYTRRFVRRDNPRRFCNPTKKTPSETPFPPMNGIESDRQYLRAPKCLKTPARPS